MDHLDREVDHMDQENQVDQENQMDQMNQVDQMDHMDQVNQMNQVDQVDQMDQVDQNKFRIAHFEGNTAHYQGDVKMKPVEDVNVPIPENMAFLTQIKFLQFADFSVYFGKLCFKVHRLKLVEKSSVLEEIVSDQVSEYHVRIEDTKLFLEVLRFVYTENKDTFKPENAVDGLKAAVKYHLPVMRNACADAIGDLNDDLACVLYMEKFSGIGTDLTLQLKNYILDNFQTVVQCKKWYILTVSNPELVYELFQSQKCTKCHPSKRE